MRVATACANCRQRRRKCELAGSGGSCVHCARKGLACSLPSSAATTASSVPGPPVAGVVKPATSPVSLTGGRHGSSSDTWVSEGHPNEQQLASSTSPITTELKALHFSLSPGSQQDVEGVNGVVASAVHDIDLQLELVNHYLNYFHDQYHSLFHPPTFRQDVEHRRVPMVIIYAMMALVARFSLHPIFADIDPKDRGALFIKHSERLFNPRDVSFTTVRAAVMIGNYWTCEGDPAGESIYVCIGTRIALLLDLSNRPAPTMMEREINIRAWWSLCLIDVWSTTGVGLPLQFPQKFDLRYPMDDLLFLKLTPFDMANDLARFDEKYLNPASSLLTQMIKLNRILAEINEFNRQTAAGLKEDRQLEGAVDHLTRKLNQWLDELPEYMRDEPENLERYRSIGLGRIFIAVYCGYYHYGQLLYYQFLHEESYRSVSSAHSYALRCKAHAASLCEIIYTAHSTPDCDVMYNMIGHILVVASTVHVHILVFSPNEDEIQIARTRLERNFQILLHLQKYWPTLEVCLLRLRVFHDACRRGTRTSWKLDRWMVRFLSEFGRPMDERTESLPEDAAWSLEGIGFSPQ